MGGGGLFARAIWPPRTGERVLARRRGLRLSAAGASGERCSQTRRARRRRRWPDDRESPRRDTGAGYFRRLDVRGATPPAGQCLRRSRRVPQGCAELLLW